MQKTIAIARGDGVGYEIMESAMQVLETTAQKFGHEFLFVNVDIGIDAFNTIGNPLPPSSLEIIRDTDALLLGPLDNAYWEKVTAHLRPQKTLPILVNHFDLFACVRPVILYEPFLYSSNINTNAIKSGLNMVVVQDALSTRPVQMYGCRDGHKGQEAFDTSVFSVDLVEKLAKFAFELAAARCKKVTCIDKSDTLDSHRLWRSVIKAKAKEYKGVKLEMLLADRALEKLIHSPSSFDVVLTPSILGDVFTAAASSLANASNLMPISNLGATRFGIYTVYGGVQTNIAGTDTVNPIGAILAASMMLSASFNMHKEMFAIEAAIKAVFKMDAGTRDLPVRHHLSCSNFTNEICNKILS